MADNVAITAGAGTTIRTDDVGGGVQVQVVKLAASADGSSADLSRAEDSAHTTGDHGIIALAVRQSSATDMSVDAANGDYEPLQVNGNGRLWVSSLVDTALPAGTNNIGDVDVLTQPGVQTDDANFNPGVSSMRPVGGTYRSTVDTVDDGDAGTFHMTQRRALHTSLRSEADGREVGVSAGDPIYMALAYGGASITPGTEYTEDDAITADLGKGTLCIARRTDSLSNLTPAANDAVGLRVDGQGALWVISKANTNTQEIVGDVAHDAVVSGNPVLNGAEARDTLAGTAVATGDAVRVVANRYGELLTSAMPPSHASSNGTPITTTTTSVIAAPSAGNHLRIVRIHMSNGGATSAWVAVRDGAAGTRHYNTWLPQGGTLSLNLNQSGVLDLTTATRLDIFVGAAASIEYEIDYFTVAD